jgi:hypothetical protein
MSYEKTYRVFDIEEALRLCEDNDDAVYELTDLPYYEGHLVPVVSMPETFEILQASLTPDERNSVMGYLLDTNH